MSETAEPSILLRREGRAGCLLMNRPKVLNALDQAMIRGFAQAIAQWRHDPDVALVLLEGAGGRGFCAGGDVARVRQAAIDGDRPTVEAFFAEEYEVNHGIASFGKPWISLIDGVCMGGGIGVSAHGSHRIVTSHALLAMPETIIALFPDVGGSHLMPRLPGAIGMWLSLTGDRLQGADAVHAGLATHYVPRAVLPELRAALVAGDVGAVERLAETPPEASFAPHLDAINRCYSQGSIPAIVKALEAEGSDWARGQLETLRKVSPTSLFVTFELLRRGATMSLRDCLDMELRLTRVVVHEHPDFREGVRALLVDKDRKPAWAPAMIEAVDPAAIQKMFEGGRTP